jgi:hypothetical protein
LVPVIFSQPRSELLMNAKTNVDRQALRQLQEMLVIKAEAVVKELNIDAKKAEEMGKSQASKAIEVAQASGSLPVFVNWVRYQAGRDRSGDFWARNAGKNQALAERLTAEFRDLQQVVAETVKDESRQSPTLMAAVVLFLGYFRRALVGYELLNKVVL